MNSPLTDVDAHLAALPDGAQLTLRVSEGDLVCAVEQRADSSPANLDTQQAAEPAPRRRTLSETRVVHSGPWASPLRPDPIALPPGGLSPSRAASSQNGLMPGGPKKR